MRSAEWNAIVKAPQLGWGQIAPAAISSSRSCGSCDSISIFQPRSYAVAELPWQQKPCFMKHQSIFAVSHDERFLLRVTVHGVREGNCNYRSVLSKA
jgi:hypothetical protein